MPISRRRFLTIAVAAGAVAGASAFGLNRALTTSNSISGDDWQAVSPQSLGWQKDRLDELFSYAVEHNSTGLIILQKGKIVAERYWQRWSPHTTADVASVQKSLTSILIGIAQKDGLLKIGDTVSSYLGEGWSSAPAEAESKITLRHLSTMTSGLDDSLAYETDAGQVWYYNNTAYHLLHNVIEKASGELLNEYARAKVWDLIGDQDSEWRTRRLNGRMGWKASVRDMARFGLLVVNNGDWNGREVVADKAYLNDALSSSQALNPSYGYLWWLNGKASFVLPGKQRYGNGSLVPAAPDDMVCALGAGDKKIYVAKSMDLVVARHGGPSGLALGEGSSSFDNLLWQKIMAAAPKS